MWCSLGFVFSGVCCDVVCWSFVFVVILVFWQFTIIKVTLLRSISCNLCILHLTLRKAVTVLDATNLCYPNGEYIFSSGTSSTHLFLLLIAFFSPRHCLVKRSMFWDKAIHFMSEENTAGNFMVSQNTVYRLEHIHQNVH